MLKFVTIISSVWRRFSTSNCKPWVEFAPEKEDLMESEVVGIVGACVGDDVLPGCMDSNLRPPYMPYE